ncbi:hypothetical protein [Methylobacterium nodulans]|uniref:Helix-turn-helix domain-containing protein n=1 Tax=Methylobacterium nodulans (strain LMG 21967 / CNCM I-2342 / ORS 2060) TaxID=460265 RepID=B8IH06_METNO|nr:hypothetical protein [Methylobacterium nodulans]ACL57881.1 hypothetical protein Mnod_2930 [Methylobacterium nodulans ORS 2060]
MSRAQVIPRLMSKAEAAAYCGFSVAVFEREVSVRPMAFGNKRLERYDRVDLDNWIETRKRPAKAGPKTMAEAIAEF